MTSIYPDHLSHTIAATEVHPTTDKFEVVETDTAIGQVLTTKVSFPKGSLIAKFTGYPTSILMQHTLQISPVLHLHDPYFIGYLGHSCDPLVFLDMQTFEMWALKEISPGPLTMDYAHTEDYLFQTFPCNCGSANCRGFITGRKQSE